MLWWHEREALQHVRRHAGEGHSRSLQPGQVVLSCQVRSHGPPRCTYTTTTNTLTLTLLTLTFNTLYTLHKYCFPHFTTVFICRHVWRQLGNRWLVVLKGNRALAQPGQVRPTLTWNQMGQRALAAGRTQVDPDLAQTVWSLQLIACAITAWCALSHYHNLTQPFWPLPDLSVNQTASERTFGVKGRVGCLPLRRDRYLWYLSSDKFVNREQKNKMLQRVMETGQIDFATPEEKSDLWK